MADDWEKVAAEIAFGNTYGPAGAGGSAGAGGTGGPASPSDLQRRVLGTIQQVLGRTFKEGDHRSFRVALEASFEYKETAGRTSYQWKPRAYPLSGGADIGGGVTGAQFSLVALADGLYEKTLPLIDGLYSLVPEVDEEQFEASRAIFRTMWSEFVAELRREGGPRVTRTDIIARGIFDPSTQPASGHLIRFGRQLGMIPSQGSNITQTNLLRRRTNAAFLNNGRIEFARSSVLTTEEEENFTSFIVLTDIYKTVAAAWVSYRDNFLMDNQTQDLGTGLLSLERLFSVLEESVGEVYGAMDSVNVDQAERLVLPIEMDDNFRNLSVEDLLSWVMSFASVEAPTLVREGGRFGVKAVEETAHELVEVTQKLVDQLEPDSNSDLPEAFKHARVINPVAEMFNYLELVEETAKAIAGEN